VIRFGVGVVPDVRRVVARQTRDREPGWHAQVDQRAAHVRCSYWLAGVPITSELLAEDIVEHINVYGLALSGWVAVALVALCQMADQADAEAGEL
jgi:hypothetical protein